MGFCLVFIYFHSLLQFFFCIYIVIFSILCFERPKVVKEMELEVIKIIPKNQLMLSLIFHFNQKIRNKREKTTFPTQRDTSAPQHSR